jgi:hypothetical protein
VLTKVARLLVGEHPPLTPKPDIQVL